MSRACATGMVAREGSRDSEAVGSLVCGFDYAPDTLIGLACESSGNNRPASVAAIMFERERTVAFRHTNQRDAFVPLNTNGSAVNVGASVADFHGVSGFTSPSLASVRTHRSKEARTGRAKTDAPAEETTRAKSVSDCAERLGKCEKINKEGTSMASFRLQFMRLGWRFSWAAKKTRDTCARRVTYGNGRT
ncbi:hypothetical protein B0G76_6670 [Paraburkholderia sp. BL23I1N1]|nr:hypothetical protein B0G76_6670 [Paraburkholderia sp. BL23I1N1]